MTAVEPSSRDQRSRRYERAAEGLIATLVRKAGRDMFTRERSVNRTRRHEEAALERRGAGDSVVLMSERRGSDQAITRLIDRLRKLVAEQRRLEERGSGEQLEARRREIVRLQRQLATVVRRELTA